MKKLYFILICLLTGCITYISEPVQKTEKIYAFMVEEDKIYLIGEQADYLLQNQDVEAMQRFLSSPYAKQILFFTMKLDRIDNDVTGEYAVYLDESKYSKEEKEKLQKQYWFNPIRHIHIDLLPAVKIKNPNWKANQPALKRQYRAFGKRVRLKNRAEILSKYAMQNPMNVALTERTSRKKVIIDDIALEFAKGVVLFPVVVAYSVAFVAVATPMVATMSVIYVINGEKVTK